MLAQVLCRLPPGAPDLIGAVLVLLAGVVR